MDFIKNTPEKSGVPDYVMLIVHSFTLCAYTKAASICLR